MPGFKETTLHEIELPSLPDYAPYIFDDASLAALLRIRTSTLWWILLYPNNQYSRYTIPKKRGLRVIHAPRKGMKYILRRANAYLLSPLHEQLGQHVTAYRAGRSVRDAVLQHIPFCPVCAAGKATEQHDCPKHGTCIQLDLQDFFPTTRRAWIRNYFKHVGYSHLVAGYLASLLTVTNIPNKAFPEFSTRRTFTGAPQGAPTSGAICNLVADWRLDTKILRLLSQWNRAEGYSNSSPHRWRYTRYADDMTFTIGNKMHGPGVTERLRQISEVIHQAGYKVNKRKTRWSAYWRRKQLLGMTFNEHPNLPADQYRRLRAIVHNCTRYGIDSQFTKAGFDNSDNFTDWLLGFSNWAQDINPAKCGPLHQEALTCVNEYRKEQKIAF